MRTYGGYVFTCKECGYKHLLDGNPHDRILVPCAYDEDDEKMMHLYDESDFKHWHGFYNDVIFNIVKEVSYREGLFGIVVIKAKK